MAERVSFRLTPLLGQLLLGPLLLAACSRDASMRHETQAAQAPTEAQAAPAQAAPAQAAPAPVEAQAAPAPAASCGTGKLECPTQRWMKANLQAHMRTRDYARLSAALGQLAEVEPKGFDGWAESARAGAEAASHADEAGVSRSCESCHKQHRDSFRRTLRTQQLL